MNLAVDQPTKVIMMDIIGSKVEKKGGALTNYESKDFWKAEKEYQSEYEDKSFSDDNNDQFGVLRGHKEIDVFDEKTKNKIDFYKFMCNSEESELENNLQSDTIDCEEYKNTSEMDFIILSLQNDIRVRSFNINGSSVSISFWTIADSISFYKQYFSVKAMRFCTSGSLCDFEFLSKELKVGKELSKSKITVNPYKAYSKQRFEGMLYGSEKDAFIEREVTLEKVSLALNQLQSNRYNYKESDFIKSTLYPSDDDNINKDKNESNEIILLNKETKKDSENCLKEGTNTGAAWTKEQFFQRVDYFNRMKYFFSKSDVKKMEALYDEGRLSFLYQNSKEISCGCFSNVVMQNAVKGVGEKGLIEIIKNLGSDIVPISATKYGAYTVQTIILSAPGNGSQRLLSQYFKESGHFLIDHEIGNYSIQKMLRFDDALVFELCMVSLPSILGSNLGLKVFKRCIEFFKDKYEDVREIVKQCEVSENREAQQMLLELLENSLN
ncbi:hypothetical protein PAEPH01_0263 [Pancytospora epiphaga]|nr:hypothetical protein PAEPH01_0263 [Pancytospora epiphaga]